MFTFAMALYLAVQQDEVRIFVAKWRKLKIISLRNAIQTQREKYLLVFLLY